MRRVVVTGMGIISPLGVGVDLNWQKLLKGDSGLGSITDFDVSDIPSKVAAQVPKGSKSEGKFNIEEWVNIREANRIDLFIQYALVAATQAIEDSGINDLSEEEKTNIGVSIGSGIGGLRQIYKSSEYLVNNEYRKISPFFIPSSLINLSAGHVSIKYGFQGPNIATCTACTTGTHSIGESLRIIKNNEADIMVAGGSEAVIFRLGLAGFARMNALSTKYNDNPTTASRPWDKGRDGFVMGEGGGVLVLEELEHAKARGAKIYAEVVGYGMSGDASHITSPNGKGAALCMERALKFAGINTTEIDYINAHGTSTPVGDKAEVDAIKSVFKDHAYNLTVSSTKSSIGHLLGAAGAVEAIYSIKATQDNVIPPTLNLVNPEDGCDLDFAPLKAKEKTVNYALSNSFGFGGTNASLIFKKFI